MFYFFVVERKWLLFWFCVRLCFFSSTSLSAAVIDIFTDNDRRIFHNASLGLEFSTELGHQCNNQGAKAVYHPNGDPSFMSYTPNRRRQRDTVPEAMDSTIQLAFVLALGGHSSSHYNYGPAGSLNGLMSVWDSWVDNFFPRVSNSSSIVLLFDERDYLRYMNLTASREEYIDRIVVGNMGARPATCVSLRDHRGAATIRRRGHYSRRKTSRVPSSCKSNKLDLDQGYKVYYISSTNSSYHYQMPLIIFAGVYKFPPPKWAKNKDEEHLYTHFRPRKMGRFKTNYAYIKMTNWYSYHMLNMKLLDFFDYGGKLDNDVAFVAPFPETNLPMKLAARESKVLVQSSEWYFDSPRVAMGVELCLHHYILQESKRCAELGGAAKKKDSGKQLIPGGRDATIFWESNFNATFRSHFTVFWLGIYTAPETRKLALFWNDWDPHGMWDYRWGDQQWWPRPLAMFGTGDVNAEFDHYDIINTDNERYVVHKPWPRQGTVEMRTNYFNFSGSTREYRERQFLEAAKKIKWGRPYRY